jgi:hypothetical protein
VIAIVYSYSAVVSRVLVIVHKDTKAREVPR